MKRSLIVITGAEGAGKTTVMSALLPHTPGGAKVDAEDVGQVNPFVFSRPFLELLRSNVTDVITNFWAAGYTTVIAGSFLDGDTYASFRQFRTRIPEDVSVYVIHLLASKPARDQRRIDRLKPSTNEWRDRVDASYPANDTSLRDNAGDYRYLPVDNSNQQLDETVAVIKTAIPEIYGETDKTSAERRPARKPSAYGMPSNRQNDILGRCPTSTGFSSRARTRRQAGTPGG